MDNTLLRRLLVDEEGYDPRAHLVDGKWHIGIGHNLDIEQSEEELEILGEYDDPSKLVLVTQDDANALFDIDVADALDDIQPTFTPAELEELGEVRRAVILSMVFQVGGAGFRKFKNFIAAVKYGDFETAAVEMMDSLAARQTPARWERASEAMRTGVFDKYQVANLSNYSDAEIKAEYETRFGEVEEIHEIPDVASDDTPEPELEPELEPEPDGTISANDLATAFFENVVSPNHMRESVMVPETGEMVEVQPFRFTDSQYKLPTLGDLMEALKVTKVDEIEYVAEDWDCEDFARRFVSKMHEQGIKTAGRVLSWSGCHAFNIVAVQGNPADFVFIEPQTDAIVTEFTDKYDLSNTLVIIS